MKGKLYVNNKLEYEGEFLYNNKWSGKGYDENGNIIYELINGNGHVKEYLEIYDYAVLEFEGEYLNGKRNGKGKEYNNYNGLVSFEGEYLDGDRNGKGKEYYDNGNLKFEGEYENHSRKKGKVYVNNKLEYEGEFLYNNKWNGKGYDENGNIIYELINGNGYKKEYSSFNEQLIYEGECLNGKLNGKVKEYSNGKLYYDCEYLNGKINGKYKEYNQDGQKIHEGEYLNGKKIT